jgi:deoxycytidylate deaminase
LQVRILPPPPFRRKCLRATKLRRLAKRSTHPLFQHAALVLKGGAVLAAGYNHEGIHAEAMALNKLWPSKRRGTTVISIRLNKSGRFSSAKPCKACAALLLASGVSKVQYSDADGNFISEDVK